MALSPDKSRLYSTAFDETVLEWDLATGTIVRSLDLYGTAFRHAYKCSPNILITSLDDTTVAVCDAASDSLIQTFHCKEKLNCIAYLSARKQFAFVYEASSDIVVSSSSSDDDTPAIILKSDYLIHLIAATNDGELLAATSYSYERYRIVIWNPITGERVCALAGHGNWIRSLDFSPDCDMLASGSDDKSVKVWHLETGSCLYTFQGYMDIVTSAAFSLDGLRVIAGAADRTIRIWDIQANIPEANFDHHTKEVVELKVSHSEMWLASASEDETVKLWDTLRGGCFQTLQGHTRGATRLSFSRDDHLLVAGCGNGDIKIWNLQTFVCINTFQGNEPTVCSVGFSSDGQSILSATEMGPIRIWDTASGDCRKVIHTSNINVAIFSPDDETVASGHSHAATVRLWDAHTTKPIKSFETQVSSVTDMVFSRDGQLLIESLYSYDVRIWDIQSYACLNTITNYRGDISRVAKWVDDQMNSFGRYRLGSEAGSEPLSHLELDNGRRGIMKDAQLVLFLPLDYSPIASPLCFLETNSFLAFALYSGRVIFITIKDSN
ncbi:hypothetical protein Golomagni_06938 [Golovinomyces magnicellulatus]|nr:hypothetical protein Golomagni_06938 [Golovinomyces magnicellulatus]